MIGKFYLGEAGVGNGNISFIVHFLK